MSKHLLLLALGALLLANASMACMASVLRSYFARVAT